MNLVETAAMQMQAVVSTKGSVPTVMTPPVASLSVDTTVSVAKVDGILCVLRWQPYPVNLQAKEFAGQYPLL
jgi:hypothetical protein